MINILDLLSDTNDNEEITQDDQNETFPENLNSISNEKLFLTRPAGFKSGNNYRFEIPDTPNNIVSMPDGTIKCASFEKMIEKVTSAAISMYYFIV